MTLHETESIDLPTPSGPMWTHVFRPSAPGHIPEIKGELLMIWSRQDPYVPLETKY